MKHFHNININVIQKFIHKITVKNEKIHNKKKILKVRKKNPEKQTNWWFLGEQANNNAYTMGEGGLGGG